MRINPSSPLFVPVAVVAAALLAVGLFPAFVSSQAEIAATTIPITYQGRLTNEAGEALNGEHTLRFRFFRSASGGSAIWNSGPLAVTVTDGLFVVDLVVNLADFDGRLIWVEVGVNGEALSPRQPLRPAPWALTVAPGAQVLGESIAASEAVFAGFAPATGTALYAESAGGMGLWGHSEDNVGVYGASANSWGGYFSSASGYGLRAVSEGTAHYDHGAYVTSVGGYGVYAQSATNQAVRGEAGNVTGIPQPLGAVGVVGIGANRGTYGSSSSGVGLYGVSTANYGVWGQSTEFRGVTGRTSRTDNNYGLYTPDNLYAANATVAGTLTQVMQVSGDAPVAPGDVVVFSGIDRGHAVLDGPMIQVRRADRVHSTAVAGVVQSRFNLEAVNPALGSPDGDDLAAPAAVEVTPAGDAAPGEYVLVVVQGPALVRTAQLGGETIMAGDLLAVGTAEGAAGRAPLLSANGVETAVPGTVFAKALESPTTEDGLIYVYVTLQ